jgi:hypothetical protein
MSFAKAIHALPEQDMPDSQAVWPTASNTKGSVPKYMQSINIGLNLHHHSKGLAR